MFSTVTNEHSTPPPSNNGPLHQSPSTYGVNFLQPDGNGITDETNSDEKKENELENEGTMRKIESEDDGWRITSFTEDMDEDLQYNPEERHQVKDAGGDTNYQENNDKLKFSPNSVAAEDFTTPKRSNRTGPTALPEKPPLASLRRSCSDNVDRSTTLHRMIRNNSSTDFRKHNASNINNSSRPPLRRIASLSVIVQKRQENQTVATRKSMKRPRQARRQTFSTLQVDPNSGISHYELQGGPSSPSIVYDVSRRASIISDGSSSETDGIISRSSSQASMPQHQLAAVPSASTTTAAATTRYDTNPESSSMLVLENIDLLTSQDPVSIVGRLDTFGREDDLTDCGKSEASYNTKTIHYDDDVSDFGHDGHSLRPNLIVVAMEDSKSEFEDDESDTHSGTSSASSTSLNSHNVKSSSSVVSSSSIISTPSLCTENSSLLDDDDDENPDIDNHGVSGTNDGDDDELHLTIQPSTSSQEVTISKSPQFNDICQELDDILGELQDLAGDTDEEMEDHEIILGGATVDGENDADMHVHEHKWRYSPGNTDSDPEKATQEDQKEAAVAPLESPVSSTETSIAKNISNEALHSLHLDDEASLELLSSDDSHQEKECGDDATDTVDTKENTILEQTENDGITPTYSDDKSDKIDGLDKQTEGFVDHTPSIIPHLAENVGDGDITVEKEDNCITIAPPPSPQAKDENDTMPVEKALGGWQLITPAAEAMVVSRALASKEHDNEVAVTTGKELIPAETQQELVDEEKLAEEEYEDEEEEVGEQEQEKFLKMMELAADKMRAMIVMAVYVSWTLHSRTSEPDTALIEAQEDAVNQAHEAIGNDDNLISSPLLSQEAIEDMPHQKWMMRKNACSIVCVASLCYLSTVQSRREKSTPSSLLTAQEEEQVRVRRRQLQQATTESSSSLFKAMIQMILHNRKASLLLTYVMIWSYLWDCLFFVLSMTFG